MSPSPLVSIIIPNLNSTVIDQTLAALRAQTFDGSQIEVLVVGLDEPGLVTNDERVRFIQTSGPMTPAMARNIGIQAAKGDLLCFTDADGIPAPDWLARLLSALRPDQDVVGGSVTFDTDHYWTLSDNLGWFHDFLKTAPSGDRLLLPSLNLCVRREVIDKVGLFDERYPKAAGEDSEWTTRMRRAGYRLHFMPEAVVYHQSGRSDLRAIWRHGYHYGRYSIKIQPEYADYLNTPFFLRIWWLVLLLAPAMAFYITLKLFWHDPATWRYWHAFPGIFLGKLGWCAGAARTLRQSKYGV
jgi:GT2 family glycosyltransferase